MNITTALSHLKLPSPTSHKGQNGKLLIIGGSELFHAASKWSLDVASKFVDMVFYSSVPSNNELIQHAKGAFWNGIVIPRSEIENYLTESDCILIGPGMTRSEETEDLTNYLLKKYPEKKWVIDAGALQMVDVNLLNEHCIITPHTQEFNLLIERLEKILIAQATQVDIDGSSYLTVNWGPGSARISVEKKTGWLWRESAYDDLLKVKDDPDEYRFASTPYFNISTLLNGCTIVLKGQVDVIVKASLTSMEIKDSPVELVSGGNPGMTKGGTGDVLAGLVAALYCTHDALTSALIGSYINKKAGDFLWEKQGPNFNASDLVESIPQVLWQELRRTSD